MLINLIILLILILNIFSVIIFNGIFSAENYGIILIILFILEAITIFILIEFFYNTPIKELKIFIKKLYTGQLKGEKIQISKSINKDLTYISTSVSDILNRLRNIKEEFMQGKAIKSEVELAKEIQGKTFKDKLVEIPSLLVVGNNKPAGEIGGDSYDIIRTNNNYYIYVGDATGHGVGAGFIMIMVNSLIAGFSRIFIKGSQILAKANEILKPRVKANLLMTTLLLRWNEKEKRLFITGAGHEYLIIYKQKTKKIHKIKSGGIALGMIKDISKLLKERELKFEYGDIAVLYSDGITEAINKPKRDGTEQMFGENRLIDAIKNSPEIKGKDYKTAQGVFNNITIKLSQFMGYKPKQIDDVTLVVVQYKLKNYDDSLDFKKEIPEELITEWRW